MLSFAPVDLRETESRSWSTTEERASAVLSFGCRTINYNTPHVFLKNPKNTFWFPVEIPLKQIVQTVSAQLQTPMHLPVLQPRSTPAFPEVPPPNIKPRTPKPEDWNPAPKRQVPPDESDKSRSPLHPWKTLLQTKKIPGNEQKTSGRRINGNLKPNQESDEGFWTKPSAGEEFE